MKIEILGDYEGLTQNRNLFYTSEQEREIALTRAEATAYKQLIEELKSIGKEENIKNIGQDSSDYIHGGFCIVREGDFWLVFHSERQVRSKLSIFTSPYNAVNFYFWSIVCDPQKSSTSVGCIPKSGTFK